MEKTLLALSSDGVTSYKVVFRRETSKLIVVCSCPAGEMGRLCRHKLGLLAGDNDMLSSPKHVPDLEEVQSWIKGSRFPTLIVQLKETEIEMARTKKRLSELKREIEEQMG